MSILIFLEINGAPPTQILMQKSLECTQEAWMSVALWLHLKQGLGCDSEAVSAPMLLIFYLPKNYSCGPILHRALSDLRAKEDVLEPSPAAISLKVLFITRWGRSPGAHLCWGNGFPFMICFCFRQNCSHLGDSETKMKTGQDWEHEKSLCALVIICPYL